MANTYKDWDFNNNFVDSATVNGGADQIGGNYVSAESVLICAGPPRLTNIMQDIFPIGIVQNFNLSQNKNIQQLFEIGSRETILLPGRTFIQSSISRIIFDGPSLLKALYNAPLAPTLLSKDAQALAATSYNWQSDEGGDDDFYINLAANMFNAPIGIALLMHDNNDDVYGGAYLESVLVAAHNMTITAGQTIVAENASLRISKVKPIKFAATPPAQ